MTGLSDDLRTDAEGQQHLVLRREYPDPVDEVWAAFTESDRLARWFGSYTGRGGSGGTVELTVTGEADAGGAVASPVTVTVHECEPPRRLMIEIPESADGAKAWQITVDIEPAGHGSVLLFQQRIVDGIDAADVRAGWRWYLDRLDASLHDTPMPDWAEYT